MRVLVVEDDRKLLSFLCRAFEEEGYVVDSCCAGNEALKKAVSGGYEIVVLDWMLPELDGLSVCRELRAASNSTSVLILTARTEVGEKVLALDAGADDYVTKPFHLDELMARVRALTRRLASPGEGKLRAGPIVVELLERRVLVNGSKIALTDREFVLLTFFLKNVGRVVSRREILAHVWESTQGIGSNVIDVYVRTLRLKLGSVGGSLETVRGRGYRLSLSAPQE